MIRLTTKNLIPDASHFVEMAEYGLDINQSFLSFNASLKRKPGKAEGETN